MQAGTPLTWQSAQGLLQMSVDWTKKWLAWGRREGRLQAQNGTLSDAAAWLEAEQQESPLPVPELVIDPTRLPQAGWLSGRDIAKHLGVSLGAVRWLVHHRGLPIAWTILRRSTRRQALVAEAHAILGWACTVAQRTMIIGPGAQAER